jgi:iron complex transport system substrate-binding protein
VLPATVTDVNGDEVVIEDVSRIIPLNGNIAETIFALGLGGNVVATDVSALYPEEVLALPKIGYQRELSAEGILAMEPTVVIGDEGAGPPEVIDQLRTAGVTVVILPVDETVAGPPALIRAVGQALGVPDAGEELAAQVETTLAEVEAMVATVESHPRVAFLYIRGQGTQLMAGTGASADTVITSVGGVNAGAESGAEGYVPITPEALVEAAPEVLLLMQGGLASVGGVEGLLAIPGIAQTPAGEAASIVAFEDLYLLGFGPRFGDAVHDVALAFDPELEGEPRHPQWQGTDVPVPEASPAS